MCNRPTVVDEVPTTDDDTDALVLWVKRAGRDGPAGICVEQRHDHRLIAEVQLLRREADELHQHLEGVLVGKRKLLTFFETDGTCHTFINMVVLDISLRHLHTFVSYDTPQLS